MEAARRRPGATTPRLGDTGRGLRDVQILFEGQGDEARQRGIIEAGPPGLEVRLALDLPALDTFLTEEAGDSGISGAGSAGRPRSRRGADTQQKGERAGVGEHDGPFGDLKS